MAAIAYSIVYQDDEFDTARLFVLYDSGTQSLRLKHRPQVIWLRRDRAEARGRSPRSPRRGARP